MSELQRQVVQTENDLLLYGTGGTGLTGRGVKPRWTSALPSVS
jgi:hypothetical protein